MLGILLRIFENALMLSKWAFRHEVCPFQPKSNHTCKWAWDTKSIPWMGKTLRGVKMT